MLFAMKTLFTFFLIFGFINPFASAKQVAQQPQVQVKNGVLQGIDDSGVRIFKGIPFAKPPVGKRRWKAPQPAEQWNGVKKANQFGPRCMQRRIYGDMRFRSDGVSEDCLYLNIWTPAKSTGEKLPVLVYFYGGGFIAGDGSEYRYEGENMARTKGIIAITVNYRLGVFGFLSHPQLTAESPYQASGNYGLLDQVQALQWVKKNIAAFGGDAEKITIAGESAGSISVSAQMASPLSRDLFRGAIGESGSILGAFSAVSLQDGEQVGEKFVTFAGAESLGELRELSGDSLLSIMAQPNAPRFPITIDGHFLPKSPFEIFAEGEQAQVPLIVGWNSGESNYRAILGPEEPTPENYEAAIRNRFSDHADEILKYYPGEREEQVKASATALAGDQFIAFSTWKWGEMHRQNSSQPVYRYYYSHPRPAPKASRDTARAEYAVHSAEIEYALGNLPTNNVYEWSPRDYEVSAIMQSFFANFIKTGNPNGLGVPEWKPMAAGDTGYYMQIDVDTQLKPAQHRERYLFLDQWMGEERD